MRHRRIGQGRLQLRVPVTCPLPGRVSGRLIVRRSVLIASAKLRAARAGTLSFVVPAKLVRRLKRLHIAHAELVLKGPGGSRLTKTVALRLSG